MPTQVSGDTSHKFACIACRCVDACSVARTTYESICARTRDRWSARKSTIVSTATRSSMALHFCRYTCARTQVTLFHSGYEWSRVLFPKHWWFLIDSQGRSRIGVTSAARASHQVVQWRSIAACTLGNDRTSVKRCVCVCVLSANLQFRWTGSHTCLFIVFHLLQWLSDMLQWWVQAADSCSW